MYRNTNKAQKKAENFDLPFGGKLSPENRWVKLAKLIPWSERESKQTKNSQKTEEVPIEEGELRQQQFMYQSRSRRLDDRIVNLTQPHVRPIVRGKAGTPVEFGAKLSVSYSDGYCFLDHFYRTFHFV